MERNGHKLGVENILDDGEIGLWVRQLSGEIHKAKASK